MRPGGSAGRSGSEPFCLPHEIGDGRGEAKSESGSDVVTHSLDQDQFGARNRIGCCSSAAHAAHAVRKAVNDKRGDRQPPQCLCSIS